MIDVILGLVCFVLLAFGALLMWIRVEDWQETRALNHELKRRAELQAYKQRLGYRS